MTRPATPRLALPGLRPSGTALFAVVIGVALTALAGSVVALLTGAPPAGGDLALAGLLLLLATVAGAAAGRWSATPEHAPRAVSVSLDSCWLIPAALVLPLALVAPLGLLLHLAVSTTQDRTRVDLKLLYSQSSVALAAGAAALVGHRLLPWPIGTGLMTHGGRVVAGLVAVLATYFVVNQVTVRLAAVALVGRDQPLRRDVALGTAADHVVEVALLSLGALLALLLSVSPALALVALPIPLAMHPLLELGQLRDRADRDGKTGLMSISAWTAEAERAVAGAGWDGSPVAVLLLDLDHFKAVNDAHGHLGGDHVLRAAADLLRAELRPGSLLGRFGGEEFVALLPGADTAAATRAAERLRARLAAAPLRVADAEVGLTVSVGVSGADAAGSLDALVASADRAMYEAKARGRNQVCVDALETGHGRPAAPP